MPDPKNKLQLAVIRFVREHALSNQETRDEADAAEAALYAEAVPDEGDVARAASEIELDALVTDALAFELPE